MFTKTLIAITMVCAMFGSLDANSVSTDQQECTLICPALYAPVCATDGKIYKEFSNKCELDGSNCRLSRSGLKTYVTTLMDWCSTELIDDMEKLLVKLNNLNITKPECLKPCAMIYQPVCVSNGKYRTVVSNECLMDNINCALGYKNTFRVIKDRTCNDDVNHVN